MWKILQLVLDFQILEGWLNNPRIDEDWLRQQVAFCAQWTLDNVCKYTPA